MTTRILCVLLLLFSVGAPLAQSKKTPNKKQLKTKLTTIRDKRKAAAQALHAVQKTIRVARVDIGQLDDRIDRVENRYHSAEEKLNAAHDEQIHLGSQLKVAEKDFAVKSEAARQRLKYIRMYGKVSFASALVGSRGVSDLASRTFVFRKIAAQDRKLFEDVKNLMTSIASKKKRSDQLVVEVKDLMVEQRNAHAELTERRQDKKEALNSLQGKAEDLAQYVRQLDQAESEVESAINANPGVFTGSRPGKLAYPVNARITSGFGMRYHPILHYTRMHKGIDFGASYGTTIHSAADGVVITAGRMSGFGNCIIISHGGGLSTVYGHCSAIITHTGARVKRGQPIGRVGASGLATGPHLHFEVHIGSKAVNPRSYL